MYSFPTKFIGFYLYNMMDGYQLQNGILHIIKGKSFMEAGELFAKTHYTLRHIWLVKKTKNKQTKLSLSVTK